jgi:hypothetical protein
MARVVGLHEIELRPEADPVEFERVAAEVVSLPMFEGWTTRLLKGERGVRAGKYLLVSRSSIRRHVTDTSRAAPGLGRDRSL